jgi:hypothetical protein
VHSAPPRRFVQHLTRNKFSLSLNTQEMHHSSTGFAQPGAIVDLDRRFGAHYA